MSGTTNILQGLKSALPGIVSGGVGSIVQGGLGLLGGLFSGNKQFKQQQKLMQQQFDLQKQMFDYTSAYNTPEQQIKRMKEAGLNPNLLYGQGSVAGTTGQTGSISGGQAPDNKMTLSSPDYLAAANQMKNQDKLADTQADLDVANAGLARAKTLTEAFNAMDAENKAKYSDEYYAAVRDLTRNKAVESENSSKLMLSSIAVNEAKINNINQDTALKFAQEITEKQNFKNAQATYHKIVSEVGLNNANKFVLGLVAKKMQAEQPFWNSNAYNECSKLMQEAARTGKLTDAQIRNLEASKAKLLQETQSSRNKFGATDWTGLINQIDNTINLISNVFN